MSERRGPRPSPHTRGRRYLSTPAMAALRARMLEVGSVYKLAEQLHTSAEVLRNVFAKMPLLLATAERIEAALLGRTESPEDAAP